MVVAHVAEVQMEHEMRMVERAVETKAHDGVRQVEQHDWRASPVGPASRQSQVPVPAYHVKKEGVLAAGVPVGSALMRHGTGWVEQPDQGMHDVVPAAEVRADSALTRHGTERIEHAVTAVETRAYQELMVPAGLPEIEMVVAPVRLQWRAVVGPVRRLAH